MPLSATSVAAASLSWRLEHDWRANEVVEEGVGSRRGRHSSSMSH